MTERDTPLRCRIIVGNRYDSEREECGGTIMIREWTTLRNPTITHEEAYCYDCGVRYDMSWVKRRCPT